MQYWRPYNVHSMRALFLVWIIIIFAAIIFGRVQNWSTKKIVKSFLSLSLSLRSCAKRILLRGHWTLCWSKLCRIVQINDETTQRISIESHGKTHRPMASRTDNRTKSKSCCSDTLQSNINFNTSSPHHLRANCRTFERDSDSGIRQKFIRYEIKIKVLRTRLTTPKTMFFPWHLCMNSEYRLPTPSLTCESNATRHGRMHMDRMYKMENACSRLSMQRNLFGNKYIVFRFARSRLRLHIDEWIYIHFTWTTMKRLCCRSFHMEIVDNFCDRRLLARIYFCHST